MASSEQESLKCWLVSSEERRALEWGGNLTFAKKCQVVYQQASCRTEVDAVHLQKLLKTIRRTG